MTRTSTPGDAVGKIEIYSETLAGLNDTWELAEDEVINPIPVFSEGFHGYGSVTSEFPLYCSGFHHKSRTHSSFGFIEELEKVARQQLWINPADAEPRNIMDGDMLAVKAPLAKSASRRRSPPHRPRHCRHPARRVAQGGHVRRQDRHGRMREHVDRLQTDASRKGQRNCSLDDRSGIEGVRGR